MFRRAATASFIAASLLTPATAYAKDDPFTISGNLRARFEAIDGQFRPATDDTAALLLRTTIAAEYHHGPIRIGGELQDSRVYFEHRHSSVSTTEVDAIEPTQAYIAADIDPHTQLKAGRFTMDLGSRRLVARNAFRNTTNVFTGARFDWHPQKGSGVTAFWTMPGTRLPDDRDSLLDNDVVFDKERSAQQFFGADATANLFGKTSAELYAYRLVEHDTPDFLTRNRRLWTIGARILRSPAKGVVDYEAEGAWQTGRERSSTAASNVTDLDVSAWFAHATIGYTFVAKWSPHLSLSYDFGSGDGAGGKYSRFDPLFGARGFDFGPTSFYGPVSRVNINSPEIQLDVKPDKRWDGYVAVRPLFLAEAEDSFASTGVKDPGGHSGRYAGTQFDARARYWLIPDTLRLAAGVAWLAKGRFLSDAPNAPQDGDTHYGYFEVSYSF